MPSARNFFTAAQKDEIVKSIHRSEERTSGEIKVHMEESCGADVMHRAKEIFQKLALHKTELRSGILIYLAIKDRKFAILADEGINEKVPIHFWDEIKSGMQAEFSQGRFLEGLLQTIDLASDQLKTHFPITSQDRNEISNDISFNE